MRKLAPDLLLGVAMVCAIALAVARTRAMSRPVAPPAPQLAPPQGPERATIVATHRRPFRRSPFRIGDASARSRGAPSSDSAELPVPTVFLEPIGVRAIVGGPPWSALMTGLPGSAGARVVRPGDRFEPVRIDRIESERVTLGSPDSSWTVVLPGRRP